jgi:hypothetical protein
VGRGARQPHRDFFGGIGRPATSSDFAGNFLYGLIPYHAWRALTDADPVPRTLRQWVAFVAVVGLAAGACGVCASAGASTLFRLRLPFAVCGNVILLQQLRDVRRAGAAGLGLRAPL